MARFPVNFFYDVISPYSWIGFEVMSRYVKIWEKLDLILKPCCIGQVFKFSSSPTPFSNSQKLNYLYQDLDLVARMCKVPLVIPANFVELALTHGSVPVMKFVNCVDVLSGGKDTAKISRSLWRQIFTNNPAPNPNTPETWLKAGNDVNISVNVLHEAVVKCETTEIKARLRDSSKDAVGHGAFGLPFFVVKTSQGPITLFGSDRIEQLAYLIGEKYYGPNP